MTDNVPGGRTGPLQPRSKEDFDQMYVGTPPWDIGRPQPAFLALADAGALQGKVLDVGCGTGEHTLMAVERGLEATGVDLAEAAIAAAAASSRPASLAAWRTMSVMIRASRPSQGHDMLKSNVPLIAPFANRR